MKTTPFALAGALLAAALPLFAPVATAQVPAADDASLFGALEVASSVSLSADGRKLVLVGPGPAGSTVALVANLATGGIREVMRGDGKPLHLHHCGWSAPDRLVCQLRGIGSYESIKRLPMQRTVAINDDGTRPLPLGQQDAGLLQFDGRVIDWLNGVDGQVLMERRKVPDDNGRRTSRDDQGLGVDLVDTRTGSAKIVEAADEFASNYVSDGQGVVRLKTISSKRDDGTFRGLDRFYFRKVGSRDWKPLGSDKFDDHIAMVPLAVDSMINAAYVLQTQDNRRALFRVSLNDASSRELVLSLSDVDVSDVVQAGRSGRVIGVTWVTDRRQVLYFDPEYKALAVTLAAALPKLPLLQFVSTSADERYVLVRASSDVDPGGYYLYDREKRSLSEVLRARRALGARTLSPVRAITYAAADGTQIPGYLTLPPGAADAKGLPAIVMPHGGPEARDEWGFDWLAQFFAQRGFAVLQPNFRGSAGYGDAWFMENGFRSWRVSVSDICDGAKWLVSQGVADPARLAVVGWSYGGYAALQANVLQPDLFKATIAIAAVTDLAQLKDEAMAFSSSKLVAEFIGTGPHVREGSPAEHAEAFRSPVLLFHGANDVNVDVLQSRRMHKSLKSAGRQSELIEYPQLEHDLHDSAARTDLLRRSDAFLRSALKLPASASP